MKWTRRQALLAACSSAIGAVPRCAADDDSSRAFGPLCVFAKPLQWLSFDELAELLVRQDWQGIEATVRQGGQVEPRNVASDLPRLVDALAKHEKQVVLFASDINSVDQPAAETTLRTASKLGIRYYRMAYYQYDLDRPILPQLVRFSKQAERLAELNRELGMTALYQNHAGTKYVGAGLWDLDRMLTSLPAAQLSVAFDIRHATVEATNTWPVHWRILQSRIGALYMKDFIWNGLTARNVPLGEGLVSKQYFEDLRRSPLRDVPISIHMEYVDHRKPELISDSITAVAADRKMVQKLLGI